jgi:photosystem II stability/assembly factor-like uncharacterized protein
LCGGQQESGSACVSSRGSDGEITFREWHPVGVEEYGYAAPDPLDPDVVFGGKLTRYDRRTAEAQDVSPVPAPRADYRTIRTQPVVFAPTDPRTLYFASNVVWKTRDGGQRWQQISPDLTRATWDVPPNVGKYRASDEAKPVQRGVVYALAPSPIDGRIIWAGTDDGLVHVTRDGGKSWRNVTPDELRPWAKVSILEAGHFDAATAYAAINTFRLDDLRPHIYRTHDGGQSWHAITRGLPDGGIVNVVREDPRRKGLLYCGTEQAVYVSFDDGDRWQALRLNMPATSIRDLIVKDDDLAVATHGRGFWILDDVAPLRQFPEFAQSAVALLRPHTALRMRFNTNTDTPLPPDEPAGKNPPDGAILDYWLAERASGAVVLEVLDSRGRVVHRSSSADRAEPPRDEGNVPRWWIRPARVPSAEAGLHRFVWDLHWPAPAALEFSYPIAAIPHDTPREPRGPLALPGAYTVRLSVDGKSYSQPLTVRMDPRLKTPAAALQRQFDLSFEVARSMQQDFEVLTAVRALRAELKKRSASPAISQLDARLAELEGGKEERRPWLRKEKPALVPWNARLVELLDTLQSGDVAPTPQLAAAAAAAIRDVAQLASQWEALKKEAGASP